MISRCIALLGAVVIAWGAGIRTAEAQGAPPKTIADILALLEQEKPDPAKLARLREEADVEPPAQASATELVRFYLTRSESRQVLGRLSEARADVEKGLAIDRSKVEQRVYYDLRFQAAWLYRNAGEPHKCVQAFKGYEGEVGGPGTRGRPFAIYKNIGVCLIALGDLAQTESYLAKARARVREARGWQQAYSIYGSAWEGHVEELPDSITAPKANATEAEQAFGRAEEHTRQSMKTYSQLGASAIASPARIPHELPRHDDGAGGRGTGPADRGRGRHPSRSARAAQVARQIQCLRHLACCPRWRRR